MDWVDQVEPFQRIAKFEGCSLRAGAEPPTAVHAIEELQEMPSRTLKAWPAALGDDWMDQVLPFQLSTRVLVSCGMPAVTLEA